MKKVYEPVLWNRKEKTEINLRECEVLEESESYLIIQYPHGTTRLITKEQIDKSIHDFQSSYERALGACRKQAYANIEGAKKAIEKYQEIIEELNKQI